MEGHTVEDGVLGFIVTGSWFWLSQCDQMRLAMVVIQRIHQFYYWSPTLKRIKERKTKTPGFEDKVT
jgi:hypothetical protein